MPIYHVLTGPTAAGKTGRLLSFAQKQTKQHLIAISADSRQVYRYMDIGTGKPSPTELEMLPHYGVDFLNPGIKYSVYQYLIQAASALASARASLSRVWVCGGTGLYIRAMTESMELGAPPRPVLRKAVQEMLEAGPPRVVADRLELELAERDNPVRVVRYAERACADPDRARRVYELAGLSPETAGTDIAPDSEDYLAARRELADWECGGIWVLDPGRALLRERIAVRVRGMFAAGLVDEVAHLRELGFGDEDVVADGIGYREAGAVLDGTMTIDEAIESTVVRTRQYAKRQRTFFTGRGWPVVDDEGLARVFRSIRG